MAGSSSNWVKIETGPKKGTRVFISNATLASAGVAKTELHATYQNPAKQIAKDYKLVKLAGQSPQPTGQAQTGLVPKPKSVPKPPSVSQPAPPPSQGPEHHVTTAPVSQTVNLSIAQGGNKPPLNVEIPGSVQGGLLVHKVSDLTSQIAGPGQPVPNKAKVKTTYKTGYQVTHIGSGTKLTTAPTKRQALAAMQALNTSGVNWLKSLPSKLDLAAAKKRVIDFVKQGV